jgi:hypothetical protein
MPLPLAIKRVRSIEDRGNKKMLQLNPQIPVVTPKGNGWAFFLIDRSQEHDLEWIVFLDDGGICWTFRNKDIRIQKNSTFSRETILKF